MKRTTFQSTLHSSKARPVLVMATFQPQVQSFTDFFSSLCLPYSQSSQEAALTCLHAPTTLTSNIKPCQWVVLTSIRSLVHTLIHAHTHIHIHAYTYKPSHKHMESIVELFILPNFCSTFNAGVSNTRLEYAKG